MSERSDRCCRAVGVVTSRKDNVNVRLATEEMEAARAAQLRYVCDSRPGIRR